MGTSRTPKYVVGLNTSNSAHSFTPIEWNLGVHGQPTEENIKLFVQKYEGSTAPGGCNEHLGPMKIVGAWISNQKTQKVVARVEF